MFVTDPKSWQELEPILHPVPGRSGSTPTSYQEQEHFKCDFCFLILALCLISSHLSPALSPHTLALCFGSELASRVTWRVQDAAEGLQRTSQRGLAVIWAITKQLWNTSTGAGPEKKQCWWPWYSWPRLGRLLLILPALLCNTNKSCQETVEKWKLSGISFLVV